MDQNSRKIKKYDNDGGGSRCVSVSRRILKNNTETLQFNIHLKNDASEVPQ